MGVPVHPTQLYESFLALGVFLFLLWFRHRQKFPGQILGIYLLLAGAVRFLVEFWRGDERGPVLLLGMPSTASYRPGPGVVRSPFSPLALPGRQSPGSLNPPRFLASLSGTYMKTRNNRQRKNQRILTTAGFSSLVSCFVVISKDDNF